MTTKSFLIIIFIILRFYKSWDICLFIYYRTKSYTLLHLFCCCCCFVFIIFTFKSLKGSIFSFLLLLLLINNEEEGEIFSFFLLYHHSFKKWLNMSSSSSLFSLKLIFYFHFCFIEDDRFLNMNEINRHYFLLIYRLANI